MIPFFLFFNFGVGAPPDVWASVTSGSQTWNAATPDFDVWAPVPPITEAWNAATAASDIWMPAIPDTQDWS